MRQIFLAGKVPDKRPPLLGDVVADRPAQHRKASLERVENRALRDRPLNLEVHLAVDARQCSQKKRENDTNHGSDWTSTDRTAGRSRAVGRQLSPASAHPHTFLSVAPKQMPH